METVSDNWLIHLLEMEKLEQEQEAEQMTGNILRADGDPGGEKGERSMKFTLNKEEVGGYEGGPFQAAIQAAFEKARGWDNYEVEKRERINGSQFYWGTLDTEEGETVYSFYMVVLADGEVKMEIERERE